MLEATTGPDRPYAICLNEVPDATTTVKETPLVARARAASGVNGSTVSKMKIGKSATAAF